MSKKIVHMLCISAVSVSLLTGCGKMQEDKEQVLENAPSALRITERQCAYPIESLLLHRWSPRAFSGELLSDQELMQLFEAARWAPSSSNNQPWRFVYAKRGTPAWDTFFNLLVDFNKKWSHNAAVLMVILSKDVTDSQRPNRTHSFDTGAAWQNLALQAASMGLIAHGMGGFDYAKAKEVLNIPDGYTVEAMVALGKPGAIENLPEEMRARETPSTRKPVETFAYEGQFTSDNA
ncbi:MAG: nitroreductase family protein [Candidatus Babeliales bacterium]